MFYNPDLSFLDHLLVCFVLACWVGLIWFSLVLCYISAGRALRLFSHWVHGVRDGLE